MVFFLIFFVGFFWTWHTIYFIYLCVCGYVFFLFIMMREDEKKNKKCVCVWKFFSSESILFCVSVYLPLSSKCHTFTNWFFFVSSTAAVGVALQYVCCCCFSVVGSVSIHSSYTKCVDWNGAFLYSINRFFLYSIKQKN